MSSTDVARRVARFALDRLGYGPRPESIDEILGRGVERWARDQLDPGPDRDLEARLRAFPSLDDSVAQMVARADDNRALNQSFFEFGVPISCARYTDGTSSRRCSPTSGSTISTSSSATTPRAWASSATSST